jgi:hypothetical protein
VTSKGPPTVTAVLGSVDAAGGRVVTITGSNLDLGTQFLFDGQPAVVRSVDELLGRAVVVPPPAPSGHRAAVIALNRDGQSSLHAQGNLVITHAYDPGEAGSVVVTPSALAAGSEGMVEISGTGLNAVDGLVSLGFGNSDIAVQRVWVTGPNRLLANVIVAANANPGLATVTLASGLNIVVQPGGFAIQGANPRQLTVSGPSSAAPGGTVVLTVQNIPAGTLAGGIALTLNDQPVTVISVVGTQVRFQVPASMQTGPAVLRLRVGADAAPPLVLGVDATAAPSNFR